MLLCTGILIQDNILWLDDDRWVILGVGNGEKLTTRVEHYYKDEFCNVKLLTLLSPDKYFFFYLNKDKDDWSEMYLDKDNR